MSGHPTESVHKISTAVPAQIHCGCVRVTGVLQAVGNNYHIPLEQPSCMIVHRPFLHSAVWSYFQYASINRDS